MRSFTVERLHEVLDHAPIQGIVSVYLFGSRAKGREHAESDTDIGVVYDRTVFPEATDRRDRAIRLQTALMEGLAMGHVDVVVLNDASPELAKTVVHTGHRILCLDAERDHAFQRDAQLRHADLQPFLERARRLKVEALSR